MFKGGVERPMMTAMVRMSILEFDEVSKFVSSRLLYDESLVVVWKLVKE